ncbi:MAG: aromatic ring-hydroxylating dioxygenase subunit alpha [Microcoleus sp. SIO2G3]|nr:aromatic ring-hydroxylating dioxygenase subunit alpha [Microcoleus sp. SIO2G3]
MTAFHRVSIHGAVQRQALTLSADYYTASEIFDQETQRIFYKHWICVGRSEQISEPGDYFLAQIGQENLIILRDSQGSGRAFFNICRHRGTRLCRQAQGHLVETIRCPFHGWTYSLEGELRSARREGSPVAGLPAENNPLFACALYEWEGFIWVNLASNPAPFTQTFAPLLHQFSPWQLANLHLGQQISYDVQANWKLIFQTYFDRFYRASATLRSLALGEGAFLGTSAPLGFAALPERYCSSAMSLQRPPLPGVQGENCLRAYYYSLFPTMLLSLHPTYAIAHRLYPQSATQTRVVCEWLFDHATARRPDCAEAIEAWNSKNRRDWQACEQMQQRLARGTTHRPATSTAFDREYLRVLGKRSI